MLAAAALHPSPASSETPADVRWMNVATLALALGLLGLLLASGLVRLSRLPYFALERIEVEGDLERNNLATVRANVAQRLSGGFFSVDLAKSREAFESVPWVRKAVVRRVFPNELRVVLEEHKPAAYWAHEDRDDQLVNTFGEVFDANLGDVEDEHLPTLEAPANPTADEAHAMLDMLHRLQPVFKPLGEIATLRLTERGSWSVELDNEASVVIGRGSPDELVARADRFVRTLPDVQRKYPAPLAYADLRYPEAYAVKLRGLSTWQDGTAKPLIPRKPAAHKAAPAATH